MNKIEIDKIRSRLLKTIPFFDVLKEVGKRSKIWLVGGSLRNLLLGREVTDWDFIVEDNPRGIARKIAEKTGSSFVVLDESFQIYRVVPSDINTFMDFTICRGTIEEDLMQRDYTVNSMAMDMLGLELIDVTGGLNDLEKRLIRVVKGENLLSDPLRILRAYRISAKYEFQIENNTRGLLGKYASKLSQTASERSRDELLKLFQADDSVKYIRMMYHDEVLKAFLPHLYQLEGMCQNRFHKYDVLNHSFYCLEELETLIRENFSAINVKQSDLESYLNYELCFGRPRLAVLKFATLLHDIGKPVTRKIKEGKLFYLGHELEGARIWRQLGRDLRLSVKEILFGSKVIEFHLVPIYIPLNEKNRCRELLYDFFQNASDAAPGVVLMSWCDVEAGRGEALTENMVSGHHVFSREIIQMYFDNDSMVNPPVFLNGKDVMELTGFESGKVIGEILKDMKKQIGLGRVKTVEEAEGYIKNNYSGS